MRDDDRSALEWALRLAQLGFMIFPLYRGAKEPHEGTGWLEIMSGDESVIRGWFDEYEGMNYGVCPGEHHVIIDLDVKEDKNGLEAFTALQSEQDVLDWVIGQTFTVKTPSGGIHLYLKTSKPAGNRHGFPVGVDVRGAHGYVVGPGCELIEGLCKAKDTPGHYAVEVDMLPVPAPDWIVSTLQRHVEREQRDHGPAFDLDTEESISQARAFLKHRDPAIEGMGGDEHTLITAMCLIDYGLSVEKVLDLLTEPFLRDGESEPQSWNDRCVPPWDVVGRKGTLEEKVKNAWRYREREPGTKSGGAAFDDLNTSDVMDISTLNAEEGDRRFARILDHLFRGGGLFARGKSREYVVPEWLPAHGLTALLARRGGGKTVVMIDMALRIACGLDWHGAPVKSGFSVIYIAGEDDEGAEEQVRAWCAYYGLDTPPENFLFLDIITDLMSAEDTREWAEALKSIVGQQGRAVIFMDTWQRASSRGGQNKDEDMQQAVHHAEALARSLNGPVVAAFHPPKHDDRVVMGSSVIENSTTAIWNLSDHGGGRRLEVTRIKGKGTGNYQMFNFEEIGIGEQDEFGNERTGIVPVKFGGVEGGKNVSEGEYAAKRTLAEVIREIEVRRKDDDPESDKHYAVTRLAKIICDDLPGRETRGDEWAGGLLAFMRDSGVVRVGSWRSLSERIVQLFEKAGYDFGDGYALRVYQDKSTKRVKIDKSGLTA